MSAASLKNKTLQLAELIISNEKYADSTGYVASTASIESALTTVSLNVPYMTLGFGTGGTNLEGILPNTLSVGTFVNTTTGEGNGTINCGQVIANDSIIIGTAPASVELTAVSNELLLGGGASILGCGNIVSIGDITLGATGDTVVLSGTTNTFLLGGGNSFLESGNITCTGTITLIGATGSGILSVNASNELLWNGVVIS